MIQIDDRLLLTTVLGPKDSPEDVALLKLDVGRSFVEAHSVNFREKNLKEGVETMYHKLLGWRKQMEGEGTLLIYPARRGQYAPSRGLD